MIVTSTYNYRSDFHYKPISIEPSVAPWASTYRQVREEAEVLNYHTIILGSIQKEFSQPFQYSYFLCQEDEIHEFYSITF